jgi:signal transduction histidine kinase
MPQHPLQPVGGNRILSRVSFDAVATVVHDPEAFRAALLPVSADVGRIEQVLLNLCINAREAMPTGGELVIASDAMRRDDDFVSARPGSFAGPAALLAVSDIGTGIDEAARTHMFESFFITAGTVHEQLAREPGTELLNKLLMRLRAMLDRAGGDPRKAGR